MNGEMLGQPGTGDCWPPVTIIIPFLNEEAHLSQCLDAVLNQSYPAEQITILAVDGGSTDCSRRLVEQRARLDSRIRVLDNPQRTASAGLNVGLLQAQDEIIVRVDAHAIIAPDYVERCVRILLANPQIGSVGGVFSPAGETLIGKAIALALTSPFSMGWSPSRYTRGPRPVDTVYLGAYRRREIEQVGAFDPRLGANEDYELNYRLRRAGFLIWCDPAIRSQTYTRRTLGELVWQYLRYGFWKAGVALRHPASVSPRHLAAPLFALAVLASFLVGAVAGEWRPLVGLCGAYILVNGYFSTRKGWPAAGGPAFLIPVVFLIMHSCWAAGFLAGLWPALWRAARKEKR